jgi:hypothetical protein
MYNSGSRWENNAHISDGPDSYWDKMSDFEVDKAVEKYGHPFFEKGDWITHISGSVAIYDGIKDIDFKSAWDQSWTKKSAGKLLEWRVMQPWEKTDAIAKWGNPQEVKFAWNDFVEYKGKLYQICYISTSKNAITAHDSEGNFTLDNKTENEHWIPLSECKKVTPAFPWFPGAVIETCNFPKFIRREKYEVGCASCKLVPFSKIKLVIEENFLKPTIERVAKVITFENGGVWEQMAPATRDRARKLAKAAIEAYNAK